MILTRVLFNYSDEFKKLILQIEIHITSLHRKWMILKRVLFHYSDEFKNLSYKSRFIAHHCIGNEWFWVEFFSTILMNSKSLSYKSRFIAHHIANEWFSRHFCSTILMNSKNLSYKSRFIAHHYIRNELCLRASPGLIIWPKYFLNRVLYVASLDMNYSHCGDLLLSVVAEINMSNFSRCEWLFVVWWLVQCPNSFFICNRPRYIKHFVKWEITRLVKYS